MNPRDIAGEGKKKKKKKGCVHMENMAHLSLCSLLWLLFTHEMWALDYMRSSRYSTMCEHCIITVCRQCSFYLRSHRLFYALCLQLKCTSSSVWFSSWVLCWICHVSGVALTFEKLRIANAQHGKNCISSPAAKATISTNLPKLDKHENTNV